MGVASQVDSTGVVADIGTDHAKIPIYLCLGGKIKYAYACDIGAGPLRVAKKNIEKYGLLDKISCVLSDGTKGIEKKDDIDTIIIAGLGGESIADIIESSRLLKKKDIKLILQPMSAVDTLRAFLSQNGYRIANEKHLKEGKKIYVCMNVQKGIQELEPIEIYAGARILDNRDEHLKEYLGILKIKLEKVIKGLEKSSGDGKRLSEKTALLCEIEKILEVV